MRPLLLVLAFLSVAPLPAAAQTFILVRHAEKADTSDDTTLSAEGRARAERLAEMLAEAGISHVFATQFRRTQQTVAPVAKSRGLETDTVAAKDTATLARRLKAGTIRINGSGGVDPALPLGGFKSSGWGRENGRAGVEAYTELKAISVALG